MTNLSWIKAQSQRENICTRALLELLHGSGAEHQLCLISSLLQIFWIGLGADFFFYTGILVLDVCRFSGLRLSGFAVQFTIGSSSNFLLVSFSDFLVDSTA